MKGVSLCAGLRIDCTEANMDKGKTVERYLHCPPREMIAVWVSVAEMGEGYKFLHMCEGFVSFWFECWE